MIGKDKYRRIHSHPHGDPLRAGVIILLGGACAPAPFVIIANIVSGRSVLGSGDVLTIGVLCLAMILMCEMHLLCFLFSLTKRLISVG